MAARPTLRIPATTAAEHQAAQLDDEIDEMDLDLDLDFSTDEATPEEAVPGLGDVPGEVTVAELNSAVQAKKSKPAKKTPEVAPTPQEASVASAPATPPVTDKSPVSPFLAADISDLHDSVNAAKKVIAEVQSTCEKQFSYLVAGQTALAKSITAYTKDVNRTLSEAVTASGKASLDAISALDARFGALETSVAGMLSLMRETDAAVKAVTTKNEEIFGIISRLTLAPAARQAPAEDQETAPAAPTEPAEAEDSTSPAQAPVEAQEGPTEAENEAPAEEPDVSEPESPITPKIGEQIKAAISKQTKPVPVTAVTSFISGQLISKGIKVTPEDVETWLRSQNLVDSNNRVFNKK